MVGELISLLVAVFWTGSAMFGELGSKRMGSIQMNVLRMGMSLLILMAGLWIFTGSPIPLYADGQTWFWLTLSGLVGYVFGDYCLFNSYLIIGSRFAQLFMTLAPPFAAISGWILLGEKLSFLALIGMLVTMSGIALSVLHKGGKHGLSVKLPLKGIILGIGAGLGQGVGLVLSKIGLNYYEACLPAGSDDFVSVMPFASTCIRAVIGFVGFFVILSFRREMNTMPKVLCDKKGLTFALCATLCGSVIGVSLSLMAVKYTEAGIASTLMALSPVFILWPAHVFFGTKVTAMEILGAFISVIGVSLFFL